MPRRPTICTSHIPPLMSIRVPRPQQFANYPAVWISQEQQNQQAILEQQRRAFLAAQEFQERIKIQCQLEQLQHLVMNNPNLLTMTQPVNVQNNISQQNRPHVPCYEARKTDDHQKQQNGPSQLFENKHIQSEVNELPSKQDENDNQNEQNNIECEKCTYSDFLDEFDDLTINEESIPDEADLAADQQHHSDEVDAEESPVCGVKSLKSDQSDFGSNNTFNSNCVSSSLEGEGSISQNRSTFSAEFLVNVTCFDSNN